MHRWLVNRARRDIIARLRARNDPPLTFQQLIGMPDGHKAHPAADHLFTQRRQAIARLPDARGNLFAELFSQTLVLFHCYSLVDPWQVILAVYISELNTQHPKNCYGLRQRKRQFFAERARRRLHRINFCCVS
ncbi:protein of unknown function [Citrobacter amalonaticus]|nr:protein of unknown function [Citrobacter amalonaticus]